MPNSNQKSLGLLLQIIGVVVLLAGLRGFFVFSGTVLYFPALAVGIVVFAVCLFGGGRLVKKSKEQ